MYPFAVTSSGAPAPAEALRRAGYLPRVRDRFKAYLRTGQLRGENHVSAAQATYFAPFDEARRLVVANAIVTVPATEAAKVTDSRAWEVAALEDTEPSALERYWYAGFAIERETLQSAEAFASAVQILRGTKRLSNYQGWYGRNRRGKNAPRGFSPREQSTAPAGVKGTRRTPISVSPPPYDPLWEPDSPLDSQAGAGFDGRKTRCGLFADSVMNRSSALRRGQ